jgi:hypothetical protein
VAKFHGINDTGGKIVTGVNDTIHSSGDDDNSQEDTETVSFCCRHISALPPHSRQLRQLQWLSPSFSLGLSTLCTVQQVNVFIYSRQGDGGGPKTYDRCEVLLLPPYSILQQAYGYIQGGSDKSGILQIFLENLTAQLKIIRF